MTLGETNRRGEMVERMLRRVEPGIRLQGRPRHARQDHPRGTGRGLYQQAKVHLVGAFGPLEDQMCEYVATGTTSPDQMDALIWALTETRHPRGEGHPGHRGAPKRIARDGGRGAVSARWTASMAA